MKRRLCFLLFVLTVAGLRAQHVHVTYGTQLYRNDLLGQVNTLRDPAFGKPVQTVNASLTGLTGNQNYDVTERVTLGKYLPQAMRVNDSVTGKISGWTAGLDMGKDLLRSSGTFDAVFMLGFSTGRMKLVQQGNAQFAKNGNVLHLTNGFFAPRGTVVFNAAFRGFSFTFGAQYAFDISSTRWKEKLFAFNKPPSVEVPGFRQTHLEVFAGIGWNFWPEEDEGTSAPSVY